MASVLELGLDGLRSQLEAMGQPAYRAQQIWEWIIKHKVFAVEDMTNLPLHLRDELAELFTVLPLEVVSVNRSRQDSTVKMAGATADGHLIETVVLKYRYGRSVCVSSQVGCSMGCLFCASALGGFVRDLNAAEMFAQVLLAEKLTGERVGHIVVMGIGEPLANYENLMEFLHWCGSSRGLNISYRNMTVSTCGLVQRIYALADEKLPVTLALSLHAPNDELRRQLMPGTSGYSLAEIIAACDHYQEATGRRVTYEYIMIKGVNDHLQHADELAALLSGRGAHVNLIPLNKVVHRKWEPSSDRWTAVFAEHLARLGIRVTIRRQLGSDIDAACGQLRRKLVDAGQGK